MRRRNETKIRIWMVTSKISMMDIARATGLAHSSVVRTIQGRRNCRAVLTWLVGKGCPKRYLDLPEDLKAAA